MGGCGVAWVCAGVWGVACDLVSVQEYGVE